MHRCRLAIASVLATLRRDDAYDGSRHGSNQADNRHDRLLPWLRFLEPLEHAPLPRLFRVALPLAGAQPYPKCRRATDRALARASRHRVEGQSGEQTDHDRLDGHARLLRLGSVEKHQSRRLPVEAHTVRRELFPGNRRSRSRLSARESNSSRADSRRSDTPHRVTRARSIRVVVASRRASARLPCYKFLMVTTDTLAGLIARLSTLAYGRPAQLRRHRHQKRRFGSGVNRT